uniref:Deoxyribonuclease II n=1 Tax=Toxocara canis TaxID=6265 RepID=A0A183TWN0_TOXCA
LFSRFVFYKIPRLKSSDNVIIQNGDAFIYFDSNYKQWTLSNVGMVSKDQPIAYTLQQYYDNSNNPEASCLLVFSIMYSDQLPYPHNGTWSSTSGHCKGVTVFSETSGFWLIHSIPKFPRNDTYEYPSNAHRYGQMGICISLPYAALSYIGELMIAIVLYFSKNTA